MPGGDAPLNTRWSMLEGLQGREAEESWRWFIDRYRPFVRSCLSRMIRPRDRAEQAAEEIWSYLFTAAVFENADRERRFRTYLAGVVRNFAYGWLRSHPQGEPDEAADAAAPDEDPALRLEQEELRLWKRQVVLLALGELALRSEHQALALRWFYGLPESMEEEGREPRAASWIARELGLQANAVHQLIFRGRRRLRSCIENELRETVQDAATLNEELRGIDVILGEENPGLEG